MRCLDARRIARAATQVDEDDEVDAHLATCLTCRRAVEEQRALHLLSRGLPAPTWSRARRSHLAAAILAAAERAPPRRTPHAPILVAAAATLLAVIGLHREPTTAEPAPVVVWGETLASRAPRTTEIAMLDAPRPLPPAELETTHARASHTVVGGRDVLTLADGEVTVDSRRSRAVDIRIADTVVHVATGRVRVRARGGALQSVQVIVGAAVIETPARALQVDSRTMWLAPPSSVDVFGDAWISLREGRAAQAIASFDRVTDPAFVEEAAYWASIAAKRAGLGTEATRRLDEFLVRFPGSPRAANARALRDAP